MRSLSPVLPVAEIEPCIHFWKALGFTLVAAVPYQFKLGFALLSGGEVTIIYQSRACLAADGLPELGRAMVYIIVEDLDAITPQLEAFRIAPTRETSYGTRELLVAEPGGHIVNFAEKREDID